MRCITQNATTPEGPPRASPRGDHAPPGHTSLPPEEMRDLVLSVRALSLFAESHGMAEAEFLLRDLLGELVQPPRR